MIKKLMPLLIILLVVVVIWIGLSIYFNKAEININPNAVSLTNPIPNSFDNDTITVVRERVNRLPVSPDLFKSLEDASKTGSTTTDTK